MMKKEGTYRFSGFAAFLFLAAGTLSAGTIAVVNPSFELAGPGTPLTDSLYSYNTSVQPYGWTVTNQNLEVIRAGYSGDWVAEDGSYSVDMNGAGAGNTVLTQTITGLDVGYLTTVTFGLAANPDWCASEQCSLQVSIGGVVENFVVQQSVMSFTDQSFQFTPTSSSAVLTFADTTNQGGNGGPAIDDVRITDNFGGSSVPEPGSALLLLGGFCGMAALARRRL